MINRCNKCGRAISQAKTHQCPTVGSRKGVVLSAEARKRISDGKKGKKLLPFTDEHKRKIGRKGELNSMYGKKPWNYGVKMSTELRDKLSKAKKGKMPKYTPTFQGRAHTDISKEKISNKNKGRIFSKEHKEKISLNHWDTSLDRNPNWRGGKSFEPYTIDWTVTLKRAIRERDKYICDICNEYGSFVHHIDYDKNNCNPNNLITLCNSCHSKTNFNRDYWLTYFSK